MSKKLKGVVASAVAVVIVGGLAVWGVLAWAASSQAAVNRDYAGAVDDLVASAESLAGNSVSLVALSDELADYLSDAEKGRVGDIVAANDGVLASASMISVADVLVPYGRVVAAVLDRPDETAQSAQSGDAAQSGEGSVSLAVMIDELGLIPSDDNPQSGDPQSGAPQSGDAAQSGGLGLVVLVTPSFDEGADFTREDVETVKAVTVAVDQAGEDTVGVARDVIAAAYGSKYEAAVANWVKANEALAARIGQADELLASSEGKVADESVRSQLRDAIAAAKVVADEDMPATGVASDLTRGTKSQAAKSLDGPMKAVSESMAAKTKADEEAARAAQEAARQAEANRAPSYDYGYDYSDNSGGGGGGGGGGGDGYTPPADTGGGGMVMDIPEAPPGEYDPNFCAPPSQLLCVMHCTSEYGCEM